MGDAADDAINAVLLEWDDRADWEDQDDYDSKIEYWSNQPLEEIIKTVRPYIDRPNVHECITGAIEDYVIFGTVGDFQKMCLIRFIARLK